MVGDVHNIENVLIAALQSGDHILSVPQYSYIIYMFGLAFGVWAAIRLKMPTPFLVGPLLMTASLAIAPGGIDVMGITAQEVQADLSTVTAYQMFRLFVVIFLIASLLKMWFDKKESLEND